MARRIIGWMASGVLLAAAGTANAGSLTVFDWSGDTGLNCTGVSVCIISAPNLSEPSQGFGALGFSATIAYDDTMLGADGTSQGITVSLFDLPAHDSIDLSFLLALMDSWDGSAGEFNPLDFFNVTVDGVSVFSETFAFFDPAAQSYVPPAGGELSRDVHLGFNPDFEDLAYDMGLEPAFDVIPHSADNLTIRFFASGDGWLGGEDESFGLDQITIAINTVPEPASLALLGIGLGVAGIAIRRRRRP